MAYLGKNSLRKIFTLIKDYLDSKFGNVENKSSATIRSEITKENVTDALGYTPVDDATTLPIEKGGTGQTSIANVYRHLICSSGANESPEYVVGFNTSYANNGYTSIQNLRNTMGLGNTKGALPIANGGTGATTVASALTNLGAAASSHTHTQADITPYVHYATGTSGTGGYVKIATFTITNAYAGMPFVFEIIRRNNASSTSKLYVRFKSENSTDPDIEYFRYEGVNPNAYIYKSGTGIWDLYIQKSQSYDSINILRYHRAKYLEGKATLEWSDIHADALPEGVIEATESGLYALASHTHSTATTSANGLMSKADKTKLDNVDSYATNIPFIVGTQTAVTGTWTGTTSEISSLVDGQTIRYWLPYNGSGNATLNLTLSDGTTTGAVACYWRGTSRLTTHYAAGSVITLTYRKAVPVAGSGSYTGWWADADYDSNQVDRTRYQQNIKCGTTAIVAGNIIVGKDGVYHHLKDGTAFDITYPILYATAAITASATGNNNYLVIPFTVTTTQSITLTAYKPVYIKGTLSGTTFTPVSTEPLTQTVPSRDDGYEYVLLGTAFSTTGIYLLPEHPVFGGTSTSVNFGQITQHANYSNYATKLRISQAIDGVRFDGDIPIVHYGECSTGASTVEKTVTVDNSGSFYLMQGSRITIKFKNTNTASSPTLNVNSTGAYPIRYRGGNVGISCDIGCLAKNHIYEFIYIASNTGYWELVGDLNTDTHYISHLYVGASGDNKNATSITSNPYLLCVDDTTNTDSVQLKAGNNMTITADDGVITFVSSSNNYYGTCSTAEATTEKAVTVSGYTLTSNITISVYFTYTVPANATLNVSSKGAKSIYYKGATITSGVIKAGDTATFVYSNSKYYLIGIV